LAFGVGDIIAEDYPDGGRREKGERLTSLSNMEKKATRPHLRTIVKKIDRTASNKKKRSRKSRETASEPSVP